MQETYGGGYSRGSRISASELHRMKKNMQKVPIIQSKSDIYHQKQVKEAEVLLSKIDQIHTDLSSNSATPSVTANPLSAPSIRQNIIYRLKKLLNL